MSGWQVGSSNGGWTLPLKNKNVGRCTIDHALTLEFHDGPEAGQLRIEAPFVIVDGEVEHRLDPARRAELGPAVALFGQHVSDGRVSPGGELEIHFNDGKVLVVPRDDEYEAWEMSGPGGMRIVCAPGGQITVWQPK